MDLAKIMAHVSDIVKKEPLESYFLIKVLLIIAGKLLLFNNLITRDTDINSLIKKCIPINESGKYVYWNYLKE